MTRPYLHRRNGLSDRDYARQERIRYQLKRMGYKLHRDRLRTYTMCNQGGYCIRSAYTGKIVVGECHEWQLDDLEIFVSLFQYKKLGELSKRSTITRGEMRERYHSAHE